MMKNDEPSLKCKNYANIMWPKMKLDLKGQGRTQGLNMNARGHRPNGLLWMKCECKWDKYNQIMNDHGQGPNGLLWSNAKGIRMQLVWDWEWYNAMQNKLNVNKWYDKIGVW